MDISIFFAQFWGWLMVILCLIFLVRRKALMTELLGMLEDKVFLLFTGYISLVLGLVTVLLHNVWVADWRVIITVFGWLALLKGIARIGFPEATKKMASTFKSNPALIQPLLIVTFLAGAWLIYASY